MSKEYVNNQIKDSTSMKDIKRNHKSFDDLSILIKYEFQSALGPLEEGRYVREFEVNIYNENIDEHSILIGKSIFKIVYIDQALNDGYNLYEIFDHYEYTFRHAQTFFNFETGEVKENIQGYYGYDFNSSNICFLERMEILAEYRGLKIGAKVIKDIIFHFGSSCGLFIAQFFPLQFERTIGEPDEWQRQLALNDLCKNEKRAFKKLADYYQSIGFDKIPRYKDLLFYNPALRNEKMDAINLEEY